jgi:isopentenyl phosphate kinase
MIQQLLSEFFQRYHKSMRLIVVHGAGSFGHYQAKQYQITNGCRKCTSTTNSGLAMEEVTLPPNLKEGVSKTRLSVVTLHRHFIHALLQQVRVFPPLPPSLSMYIQEQNGE